MFIYLGVVYTNMTYFTFHKGYISNLSLILAKDSVIVGTKGVILLIKQAKKSKKTIYICGNGGHASTSNHFATDLCTLGIKAVSLTANPSEVTRLGNDFGYERIFDKQLTNTLEEGDVVIGISASGNSVNVVKALQLANKKGAYSVAMVGFKTGGKAKKVAKHKIHIETEEKEYGLVEDAHMTLCHIISFYLSKS